MSLSRRLIMNVELVKEHENGDATYVFELTNDEAKALLSFGILEAIKAGIRSGEKITVEGADLEDFSHPGLSD
jgi:hypothetical protein